MGIIWSRRKGFNFTKKNVTGSAGVSIISYFYGGIYTKMRQMRRCAGMKLECTEISCALHWEGVHNRQEKKRKTIYVLSNTIHRLPVSAPVLSERMHICGAEQPRLIGFGWNDYFSFNLMQIKRINYYCRLKLTSLQNLFINLLYVSASAIWVADKP